MQKTYQDTDATTRAATSETSDCYRRVIVRSGHWRIIRCKDDLQFIVQRRQAGSAKFPWRACAYVVRETALPAVLQRLSIPHQALTALETAFRSRPHEKTGRLDVKEVAK